MLACQENVVTNKQTHLMRLHLKHSCCGYHFCKYMFLRGWIIDYSSCKWHQWHCSSLLFCLKDLSTSTFHFVHLLCKSVYAGCTLFPWHGSLRAGESPITSLCVVCEREKEPENERAYCTGVHLCVNYSVTSALLCLRAESSRLMTTRWVMRAKLLGFSTLLLVLRE